MGFLFYHLQFDHHRLSKGVRNLWKTYAADLPIWNTVLVQTWCVFDIADKAKQVKALEKESGATDFWNDQKEAQTKMRQLSDLRDQVETWQGFDRRVKDALELIELAATEEDDSLVE